MIKSSSKPVKHVYVFAVSRHLVIGYTVNEWKYRNINMDFLVRFHFMGEVVEARELLVCAVLHPSA